MVPWEMLGRARTPDGAELALYRRAHEFVLRDAPDALPRAANQSPYPATGLAPAKRALRRGGALAVWSAFPDDHSAHRLRRAGFTVETHCVRARGPSGGARHIIFVARA